MLKIIKRRSKKKQGLPPGSLVLVGEQKTEKVHIKIIDYDQTSLKEFEAKSPEECLTFRTTSTITWIDVDGLHKTDIIQRFGDLFDIHPLMLEDILNTGHRPKIEGYPNLIFVVLKMLYLEPETGEVTSEQVSILLGHNFVLSFQERPGDVFDAVRQRIFQGKGRLRKMGADYLAYALIDAIVDSYFFILENMGDRIEALEEALLDNPTPKTLHEIHTLRREMLFLRRSVWPLREILSFLERDENTLIKETSKIFFKDVYDHTIQVIDTIEAFRDVLTGMLDLYLSTVSNRMNEIMKVLTIIATIFIPLTFIAGIYGMNFQYMPELAWHWGYLVVWLVMVLIGIGMVLFFRRKKWL